MASNPIRRSRGFQVRWLYAEVPGQGPRWQSWTEQQHADAMALKRFVDALDNKISDEDPRITTRAFLAGADAVLRPGALTLAVAADRYNAWAGISAQAARGRCSRLQHRWGRFWDRPLTEITPELLNEIILDMKATLKPATTLSYVNAIAPVLRWATDVEGALAVNPAKARAYNYRRPRRQDRASVREAISRETFEALLALPMVNETLDVFLRLLGDTGMRLGEILALNVADVDTTLRRVYVEHHQVGRTKRAPGTKAGADVVRRVGISTETALRVEKFVAGRASGAPLFASSRGKHFNTDYFRNVFWAPLREAALAAGILREMRFPLGFVPHTLRHSFATWMAKTPGMTAPVLQVLMGHTDLKTTMLYFHMAGDADEVHRRLLDQM